MSDASTASGYVEYTCNVAPYAPAGTPVDAPTVTNVPIETSMLWRVEVRIPPGHSGVTGLAFVDSGAVIIPFETSSEPWLIGDDDDLKYPYDKEVGSNVVLWTYNTGIYDHRWQVRLIYTPMTSVSIDSNYIVTPAPPDWINELDE